MKGRFGHCPVYVCPVSQTPSDAEVAAAEAVIAARNENIKAAKRRALIECYYCGGLTHIDKLTYVQTHFYVRPYGCTGGDYWKAGNGEWFCPSCNGINRLLYDCKPVDDLRDYFGRREDKHER